MSNPYDQTAKADAMQPEALLEEYLPLIRYHAGQLMRRTPDSVELDDLIDAGVLGLLDAASRFDPERGIQFNTFIAYRVRGAMVDYLRAFDWMPRSLRDVSRQLQQAMLEVEQRQGRPADEHEIADFLGISVEEYRKRLDQVRVMSVVHFDDLPITGDDGDTLSVLDAIAADQEFMPEEQAAMIQFVDRLAEAIARLPKREAVLLTLYYHEELNMKEVALVLGLTESRVSQIHSQMVARLRGYMGLDRD
ncbi:MAG: FliA/WhiG family RNA polymerase sigma factor [Zetaproteobacteria bacterium]|nr:MAG: FliA/WhiG family RNA polymerase sigma factor [Zetaproteobacteria bacterium]